MQVIEQRGTIIITGGTNDYLEIWEMDDNGSLTFVIRWVWNSLFDIWSTKLNGIFSLKKIQIPYTENKHSMPSKSNANFLVDMDFCRS